MYRYQEKKIIGRGNYGTAYLVKDRETGTKYVVKRIPLMALSEKEREDAESECKLLAKLHHPNIVEYVDSFLEDESLHLVTQYCELGDLSKLITKYKKKGTYFSEKQIIDWFIQIAMAVDHIHSKNIMHRDLKTGNVFLTKTNVVRLGDFGIAKVLDSTLEQANTVVGTPYYLSPEVCENKKYDKKSDLWAMGCILYELCTLNHAFQASNLLGLVYKIVQESYPPIPDHYSTDLKELVKQLLSKDPAQRPSCRKIFRLPFIKKRLENLAKAESLGEIEDEEIKTSMATTAAKRRKNTSIPVSADAPMPPTMTKNNKRSSLPPQPRSFSLSSSSRKNRHSTGGIVIDHHRHQRTTHHDDNSNKNIDDDHHGLYQYQEEEYYEDEQDDANNDDDYGQNDENEEEQTVAQVVEEGSNEHGYLTEDGGEVLDQQQQQQQCIVDDYEYDANDEDDEEGSKGHQEVEEVLVETDDDGDTSLSSPPPQTPSDRLKERRDRVNRQREEEIRQATLRNYESRNIARRRSDQLFLPSAENNLLVTASSLHDDGYQSAGSSGTITPPNDPHHHSNPTHGQNHHHHTTRRHHVESKSSISSLLASEQPTILQDPPSHKEVRKLRGAKFHDENNSSGEWDDSIDVGSDFVIPSPSNSSHSSASDPTRTSNHRSRARSGSSLYVTTKQHPSSSSSVTSSSSSTTATTTTRRSYHQHRNSYLGNVGSRPRSGSNSSAPITSTSSLQQQQARSTSARSGVAQTTMRSMKNHPLSSQLSTTGNRVRASTMDGRPVVPYNHDERPIRASGRYSLENWEPSSSHQTIYQPMVPRQPNISSSSSSSSSYKAPKSSDDYYSDDFESDDDSDEEDNYNNNDDGDLTPPTPSDQLEATRRQKVDQQDAERVLQECKKLSSNEYYAKKSISSGSTSSITQQHHHHHQQQQQQQGGGRFGPDWKQIASKQRLKLRQELGDKLFSQVYGFLKRVHSNENGDNSSSSKENQRRLKHMVGKEKLSLCFEVDQLIWIEEVQLCGDGK